MAWVWDSEVLNCPYVNQPINAEQSHITSALISPDACEDMSRIWESFTAGQRHAALSLPWAATRGKKDRRNKKRMKHETEKNTKC